MCGHFHSQWNTTFCSPQRGFAGADKKVRHTRSKIRTNSTDLKVYLCCLQNNVVHCFDCHNIWTLSTHFFRYELKHATCQLHDDNLLHWSYSLISCFCYQLIKQINIRRQDGVQLPKDNWVRITLSAVARTLTLWPWSWIFTVQLTIYVKCEYFMNQEEQHQEIQDILWRNKRRW